MTDSGEGVSGQSAWWLFILVLVCIVLCVGAGGALLAGGAYNHHYADRIYPGVNVYGVGLSGLTAGEAAAALEEQLPDPAALPVTVRAGERAWNHTWADLGLRIDPLATARLAYEVGRVGTSGEQWKTQLRALVSGWPMPPVVVLPDPVQAAAALETLAPEVGLPPVDAALIIRPDGVVPVPAQAGRELDVQATVAALPRLARAGPEGLVIELMTRQVGPAIGNTAPAKAQAEAMLGRSFTLIAEDRLTGFSATRTVGREILSEWLVARPVQDEDGARLVLTVEEEAVRAYLDGLGGQLPSEVAINVEATLPSVKVAVESGESQATLALRHPPHTYSVQFGDTLSSVARAHGFPVWHLMQANGDIALGELRPGQEIVIPSLDVLYPLPLITDRRIVIDISDQRLYAYEGGTRIYDFACSTGIASSPTFVGTFQVLSKEDNAYASSWDLWMPHFLGIYQSGPDFTNGIHALPILSSGARLWEGYLGRPVSYGCIVLGVDEAAALYEWAELGTMVVIQD